MVKRYQNYAFLTLVVRRIKINLGVLLAHARMLSKTTAKYPFTRVEVKTFTIYADVVRSIDNAIFGHLLKRIIVDFVDNNEDRTRLISKITE